MFACPCSRIKQESPVEPEGCSSSQHASHIPKRRAEPFVAGASGYRWQICLVHLAADAADARCAPWGRAHKTIAGRGSS
jgi:hypothetical protein